MDYIPNYLNSQFSSITRIADNTSIPICPDNTDYQIFLEWLIDNSLTQEAWLEANPWYPWGNLTLEQYKAQQIAQLKADCDALALTHYPQTNQVSMVVILIQAAQQGLTNRAAYLNQVWTWALAITTLYYQKATALNAAFDFSAVQVITWIADLDTLSGQDPNATIQQALAIND